MRALAALYVVIGHICSMVDPNFLRKGASGASVFVQGIMWPFWHGHLAVASFIVISGFCLQYGLFQRGDGRVYGLGKFFKRRAMRILPAYYACLAISVYVCFAVTWPNRITPPFDIYVKASSGEPVTSESLIAHLLMIHNWSLDWMYRINGVLWSIAIEAQLYLLFPWFILIMQKKSPFALLASVTIPALLIIGFVPGAGKMYPWFAILFVVGMMAAHFAFRPNRKVGLAPNSAFALSVLGVVGTIGIGSYFLSQGIKLSTTSIIASDLTFGVSTAAFLYTAVAAPGSMLERFFSTRWLVRLGMFSYSLYLLHHPIIQVLQVNRPEWVSSVDAQFCFHLFVTVPVSIAVSYVFSLFFERPFVKSFLPKTSEIQSGKPIPLPLPTVLAIEANYAYMIGEKEKESRIRMRDSLDRSKAELY